MLRRKSSQNFRHQELVSKITLIHTSRIDGYKKDLSPYITGKGATRLQSIFKQTPHFTGHTFYECYQFENNQK